MSARGAACGQCRWRPVVALPAKSWHKRAYPPRTRWTAVTHEDFNRKEDIKAGSIRVFLSSLLKKIDDEGLRQGEIKKAIGPALVDAKYAAIGWLDKDQETATAGAIELRETLRNLAATSDLRQLGDYAPSMRRS